MDNEAKLMAISVLIALSKSMYLCKYTEKVSFHWPKWAKTFVIKEKSKKDENIYTHQPRKWS